MKIAIIGTDGLPARYGGFETFAMEVSPRMAALGHEVLVVGSSVGRSEAESPPPGIMVKNLPVRANGIASIPFDLASFASVFRWADCIMLMGVSAGPFVPLMRRLTRNGKLVVNVDGLESRRAKWSRWGKRYLAIAESLAIRSARHVVADNMEISNLVREKYHRTPEIIAYGNDHVLKIDDDDRSSLLQSRFGLAANRFFLTVARIEPENNIEVMLSAAANIPENLNYVVVGNFDGSEFGRMLIQRYHNSPVIRLIAATYDPLALAALRSGCRAYLHGHSVGGTNPSLVEILPYGRPIISFECPFNRYTLSNAGAYFTSESDLRMLLLAEDFERYAPPPELQNDMRYQWQAIAEHYAALAGGE